MRAVLRIIGLSESHLLVIYMKITLTKNKQLKTSENVFVGLKTTLQDTDSLNQNHIIGFSKLGQATFDLSLNQIFFRMMAQKNFFSFATGNLFRTS